MRVARALLKSAAGHDVDMPLVQALCAIYDGLHPLDAVTSLMGREAQPENR